jgi:hypothetical protein
MNQKAFYVCSFAFFPSLYVCLSVTFINVRKKSDSFQINSWVTQQIFVPITIYVLQSFSRRMDSTESFLAILHFRICINALQNYSFVKFHLLKNVTSFRTSSRITAHTVFHFCLLVFWVVTPCSDAVGYQRFGGPCCLHLQSGVELGVRVTS